MVRTTILAAAMALGLGSAAQAADYFTPEPPPAAPEAEREGWRVQITPYVWAPKVDAGFRPASFLPTVHVERSFKEVLEDLEGAFFLTGTARYDRLLLFADFTWAKLSQSASARVLEGLIPISAKGEVNQKSLTLAAGYTMVQDPRWTVDVLAGLRAWHYKLSASVTLDVPIVGPLRLSHTERESWVDPIVGGRVRYGFAPRWSVIGYADVGGFGTGSDLTWQAFGTVNYQASEHIFLSAGYRHMEVDYDNGSVKLDMEMSGPLLGATWRF